ncbi:MAG: helix-turn-helix domain-containing protein [Thermoguttaceae bacterium]
MARHRFHVEFVKLLESASQPLYVLDDALTIIYLNEACRNWLGDDSEELLGRKCFYSSGNELTGLDTTAAGLCPPPAVLEGREASADVVNFSAQRQGGALEPTVPTKTLAETAKLHAEQTRFRRARFVPLRRPDDEVLCIIALVDPQDRDEKIPDVVVSESSESQELHEQLQRFRQQTALRYCMERVVGVTPAMRRARAQVEVATGTLASVLLLGPPGSGRRHLAEVIHYGGPAESCGPLVPLESGFLDVELIQSTFRSITAEGKGGGTLLFSNADQLTAESQAVLATILPTAKSPLRLISTAATPLVDLSPRGLYRDDLAAMLSTITIELPPLAKRREDLPLLAQALLEEQNARSSKQLGGFSAEAIDRICAYGWPGNVAELADVVAEGHARAAGRLIARDELPERLRLAAEAAARPRRKEEPIQLDEFVARIERELIRRALAHAKGNKTKAARLLGLNRPRLYRRMVQLGLAEEGEEK